MDKKIKVLTLLTIILAAAFGGSLVFALQSTVKADSTNNNIASDVAQPALSSVNQTVDNASVPFIGHMHFVGTRGFGEFGKFGCSARFGQIQVSSDFTANITNIAKNDSDVQNLLTQGYNITSIRPIIITNIDGNGNLVTKATAADLILLGSNDKAFVVVDLSQNKVTKIVTLTMTEIDK